MSVCMRLGARITLPPGTPLIKAPPPPRAPQCSVGDGHEFCLCAQVTQQRAALPKTMRLEDKDVLLKNWSAGHCCSGVCRELWWAAGVAAPA